VAQAQDQIRPTRTAISPAASALTPPNCTFTLPKLVTCSATRVRRAALRETLRVRLRDLDHDLFVAANPGREAHQLRMEAGRAGVATGWLYSLAVANDLCVPEFARGCQCDTVTDTRATTPDRQ
jgi:hypothetical protein